MQCCKRCRTKINTFSKVRKTCLEHVCQCQKSKVMAKGLKRTKAIVSRSLLDIKYIFYCQNT